MKSVKKILVVFSVVLALISLTGCPYYTHCEDMWVTTEGIGSYNAVIANIYGQNSVYDFTVSPNRHKVIQLTSTEYRDFCNVYRFNDNYRYWSESDVYDQLRDIGLDRWYAEDAAEEFFNCNHCLIVVRLTYNPDRVMVFLK